MNRTYEGCTVGVHSRILFLRGIIIPLLLLLLFGCGGGGGGGSSSGGAGSSGVSPVDPSASSVPSSPTRPGSSVTLTWDAPTTNTDGTPLTDLAGYKLYYGTSSANYAVVVTVGNVATYKVDGLQPGTYYFAVTAYDTDGNESTYSNEVAKQIL